MEWPTLIFPLLWPEKSRSAYVICKGEVMIQLCQFQPFSKTITTDIIIIHICELIHTTGLFNTNSERIFTDKTL